MTPEERAKWDVDPNDWPHSPPLHVFRELMDEDDNLWWRAGSGYGLNAYEQAIEEVDRLVAGIEALAKDEPLLIHGIRRDLDYTPRGRGGTVRHTPETSGWGASGCPGDNIVAWADRLRALLPTREQEGDR